MHKQKAGPKPCLKFLIQPNISADTSAFRRGSGAFRLWAILPRLGPLPRMVLFAGQSGVGALSVVDLFGIVIICGTLRSKKIPQARFRMEPETL
jgi:hypothetical protein